MVTASITQPTTTTLAVRSLTGAAAGVAGGIMFGLLMQMMGIEPLRAAPEGR